MFIAHYNYGCVCNNNTRQCFCLQNTETTLTKLTAPSCSRCTAKTALISVYSVQCESELANSVNVYTIGRQVQVDHRGPNGRACMQILWTYVAFVFLYLSSVSDPVHRLCVAHEVSYAQHARGRGVSLVDSAPFVRRVAG